MSTHATIKDALLALPVGADAIAEHLADLNVKAECCKPSRCAIAVYLAESMSASKGAYVSVGATCASLESDDEYDETRFRDIGRADVEEFIERFDCGEYPGLVAEPALAAA